MAANTHIRKGTVLAFTTPKGVPVYVYVARRRPNANHGLGYVFVAADVDLEQGLVADDAVTCCRMGFKDTVGGWSVVASQPHDDAEWPDPKMYVPMPGLEGKIHYRLDTFAKDGLTVIKSEKATAEQCRGRPSADAFHAGAVPYYLDNVLAEGGEKFRDMTWWQALRAGDPAETE